MPISLISASLLGLLLVYLSIQVTNARQRVGTDGNDHGDQVLHNAVRAHGNLTEYLPTGLILIALLELSEANIYLVGGIAAVFVLARFAHGLTFGKFEGRNPYRFYGTALTFLSILVASLAALYEAILWL